MSILWELLCRHGYETQLSNHELEIVDLLPIKVKELNEQGKEICRGLVRKNIIKIVDDTVYLANKSYKVKECAMWFIK